MCEKYATAVRNLASVGDKPAVSIACEKLGKRRELGVAGCLKQ
jgi:hypothetical protein